MFVRLRRKLFPMQITKLVYIWMMVLIIGPVIFLAVLLPAASAQMILVAGILTLALSTYFSWRVFNRLGAGLRTFAEALTQNDPEPIRGLLPELDPVLDVVKKRAQELIRANARFYKAFCASPSIMCIVDFDHGFFLDVNASFVAATGYKRAEVLGQSYSELKIWPTAEDLTTLERKVLHEGKLRNYELSFLTKEGLIRIALISTELIELDGQDCLLVVGSDITKHKKFEIEMLRFDRLNLVGEMAAGISHEIRNPLTTVRGFLQMLSVKGECAAYKDYYTLMIEELDRANSIITEFLSLGRNKNEKFEEQDLNGIVKALNPLIEANAVAEEKSVVLDLDEIPKLLLNEKEIRQVILNLARNGLEAMGSGGTLTIRTLLEADEVILDVEDEGTGIVPEVLAKLGTPFLTTKEQGTGLGLAVCYSIADRHNARISVDSGTQGTAFKVRFKLL
ncbi:hypothetical protein JCM15765_05630 [Paradesulfitobacterium aromaticivorans]